MNGRLLCYLIGPPGAGKSTLMADLTRHCARLPAPRPVAHEALMRHDVMIGAEIGRRRDTFSGTDALPMNAQPAACRWVAKRPYDLMLAEGARLATTGFLLAARAAGYRVLVVALDAPETVLRDRRTARGTAQNPAWVKGASTRARRLPARLALDATIHYVDAEAPTSELTEIVVGLDPALEALA